MTQTSTMDHDIRILVVNPNSSQSMSQGMGKAVKQLPMSHAIHIQYYTAPSSAPPSIDDASGIYASTTAVLNDSNFQELLSSKSFDAILIACYSVHQLVPHLSSQTSVPVTGIFEASILTSISLLPPPVIPRKWGIVTTGAFWEDHLTVGVRNYLEQGESGDTRFAGVFTTGLNAGDFHDVSPEEVSKRLKDATRKLLKTGRVQVIIMGCAGMAGLEDIIRSTVRDEYSSEQAQEVCIVDGVKAGILQLEQTVRSKRAFN